MHGDGADAQALRAADDPTGDLATVGDEQRSDHGERPFWQNGERSPDYGPVAVTGESVDIQMTEIHSPDQHK
ncbi:hypothetical protein GCM10009682_04880 [Luedemannella flava]|uniref:Uncharacterized protein n=1 Tax=Luedemannella flava TaxID=349316 RepID=A0ABN2LEX6_9ACTN